MTIVGIVALGLILRLINLNQSLWLDEAVQAITAQNSFAYIFQEIQGDFHPPLYYFLMHFWVRIFGSSEIALRMPSVLFGIGVIWVIYKIGRLSNLKHLSYLGALLLAISPFHIYYSQEARMYSMSAFLTAVSIFFFLKVIDGLNSKSMRWNILGYFISTLSLIYTDYYGFLVLLAQLIYLLIKKKYKFLILNSLFIILCYLPWLPTFVTQIKVGVLATKILPEWGQLVNVSFFKAIPLTLVKFTIGRITIFDKDVYALVSLVILGIAGGLMGFGCKKFMREKTGWGRVILLWFFVPLLFSWFASLIVPNFQPFRILLILPAFCLLLAGGIQAIKFPAIRTTQIFLLFLINIFSLGTYYLNQYFWREDWRGLTKYVKSEQKVPIILPSENSNWPIRYYDPSGEIKIIYGSTGLDKAGSVDWQAQEVEDKIFYVRYLVPLFDPEEKILAELTARGYTKVGEKNFNQIPVWEYQR